MPACTSAQDHRCGRLFAHSVYFLALSWVSAKYLAYSSPTMILMPRPWFSSLLTCSGSSIRFLQHVAQFAHDRLRHALRSRDSAGGVGHDGGIASSFMVGTSGRNFERTSSVTA